MEREWEGEEIEEEMEFRDDLFGVSLVGVSLAAYSTSNRDRLGDGGTDDEGVGGGDVVEANLRGGVVGRLEDIRKVLFRGSNSCVNN